MWYEKWDFVENPYGIKKTKSLLPERIIWNRDDLKDKKTLHQFLDDILNQRSVSLRIWGPTRSGKTWLLKYIEKTLKEKLKDRIIIVYTEIPEAEPTLDSFYVEFIRSLSTQLPLILEKVKDKIGDEQRAWREFFDDFELGSALHHIHYKSDHKPISDQWLRGVRLVLRY